MSFIELLEIAKELPLDLKLELIDKINESINYPVDSEVEAAWTAEIKNRIADIDSGTVTCIPYEDIQQKIEKKLV